MHECMICEKPLESYEPEICCEGHECGCMGQPVNPPICSNECWDRLMSFVGKKGDS